MAKESIYKIDSRIIFKETFNNEQTVRRNSGVPVDVGFSEGVGSFNGSSSEIEYPAKNIGKEFSFRALFTPLTENDYFMFFSGNLITGAGVFTGFNIMIRNTNFYIIAENLYYNLTGLATDNYVGNEHELIVTVSKAANIGYVYYDNSLIANFNYHSNYDKLILEYCNIGANQIGAFSGGIGYYNLIKIYNTALTVEEVANLYNKTTYRDIRNGLILDIDARQGVIEDRMGNALTLYTGTSVKNNHCYFDGTNYGISPTLTIPSNGATINVWARIIPYSSPTAQQSRHALFGGKIPTNSRMDIPNVIGSILIYSLFPNPANVNSAGYNGLGWHMYSITIDSFGNSKVYFDGKDTGVGIANQYFPSILYFGSYFDSYYKLRGYQNQMRIYNRALSAQEITQLFSSQKYNYI